MTDDNTKVDRDAAINALHKGKDLNGNDGVLTGSERHSFRNWVLIVACCHSYAEAGDGAPIQRSSPCDIRGPPVTDWRLMADSACRISLQIVTQPNQPAPLFFDTLLINNIYLQSGPYFALIARPLNTPQEREWKWMEMDGNGWKKSHIYRSFQHLKYKANSIIGEESHEVIQKTLGPATGRAYCEPGDNVVGLVSTVSTRLRP